MKIKFKRSFSDYNIGIIGIRGKILGNVLEKNKIKNFSYIDDAGDISSNFDFIFVSGYYKIISAEVIKKVRHGIFCFHESPLPRGRGHAPIQWALLNKEKKLTISMFKIDHGVDTGLICCQHSIDIKPYDCYGSLNIKRKKGIGNCFQKFINIIKNKEISLTKQIGKASYQQKRNPTDSILKLSNDTLENLWEHIRLCDNEQFPAFFEIHGRKVVLKYQVQNLEK